MMYEGNPITAQHCTSYDITLRKQSNRERFMSFSDLMFVRYISLAGNNVIISFAVEKAAYIYTGEKSNRKDFELNVNAVSVS